MSIPERIASMIIAALATVSLAKDAENVETIRDGSSFEKAIIVNIDPASRIRWEMAQIRRLHPDANLGDWEGGIVHRKGRVYDVYELQTASGKKFPMYFDIGAEK